MSFSPSDTTFCEPEVGSMYDGWFPYWTTEERRAQARASFANELRIKKKYSKDYPEIKNKKHLIFVYDSMKKGFSRHNLFALKKKFHCKALTKGNTFKLYSRPSSARDTVAIYYPGGGPNCHRIEGELWEIDGEELSRLDFMLENGVRLKRIRSSFHLLHPYTKQSTEAWWYIGEDAYWLEENRLVGMMTSNVYQRNNFPKFQYYTYTHFHKSNKKH